MRISINLAEDIVKQLDKEAKKLGIPRSSMIAGWIGERLKSNDVVQRTWDRMTEPDVLKLLSKYAAEMAKDETSDDFEQTNLDL